MKIATAIILFIGFHICFNCHAQTVADFKKMQPEQKAKLVTDSLKKILVLTADQYGKVYPAVLETIKKAMPVINSDNSRISKRQQLKELVTATETRLEKFLTQAQFALYQKRKQQLITYYRNHWQTRDIVFTVPE
jgi:hypothetical protein